MSFLLLLCKKACLAIYKKIFFFNNFLIAAPRRNRTLFFQKLPSPAPAPESGNTLVLHSSTALFDTIHEPHCTISVTF